MSSPDYGLKDRTVLVTGAAGGIGTALARAFAAQGARLMLLDRAGTGLHDLCAELERQGVRFSVVHTMRDVDSRLLVRLGGSSFVCDTAVAEFEAAAG